MSMENSVGKTPVRLLDYMVWFQWDKHEFWHRTTLISVKSCVLLINVDQIIDEHMLQLPKRKVCPRPRNPQFAVQGQKWRVEAGTETPTAVSATDQGRATISTVGWSEGSRAAGATSRWNYEIGSNQAAGAHWRSILRTGAVSKTKLNRFHCADTKKESKILASSSLSINLSVSENKLLTIN